MQKVIGKFLEEHRIPKDSGFIMAVSGGPDSMALLHIFKYMNLKIYALHCNFGLRGKESNMDEQFVKRFCETYGIPLSVKKFDTARYAAENGISIEMAARELRYRWFREMLEKKKMDYIVTGHHADDVAETIFINICRGTGIRGLTGIKPVKGNLLRPLLSCSRAEILNYLQTQQVGYRIDSSNQSLDFVRNKIRHKIIPVCKEINPSFLSTVRENCHHLTEVYNIYTQAIRELQAKVTESKNNEILIHIRETLSTPAPYTLLYEILKPYGFNKTQTEDILGTHDATPGKKFYSEQYLLTKGRTYWRLYKKNESPTTVLLLEKEGEFDLQGKIYRLEIFPRTPDFQIPSDPAIGCFDADKLHFPLTVRNWEKGDRFCPLGMNKLQKKVSDFFIDQKFSTKQKEECRILLSDKKIAWIIGHRPDERFKVSSLTQRILQIKPLP